MYNEMINLTEIAVEDIDFSWYDVLSITAGGRPMTKQRITKKWLKNHVSYSWWKYLLLAAMCVFSIDMLFSMTAYRAPEEKKVEVYILNDYVAAESVRKELEPLFFERCPDQEELSVLSINIGSDDMYARMQFTTYAAARQGDVYMLPVSELQALTQEGPDAFVDLTSYLENGVINAKDIDLSSGVMRRADGTTGIYAIPADTLYGLMAHGNDPAGSMLCLTSYGGNDDHAAEVLNLLIERYHSEKPEDYDRMHKERQNQSTLF